MADIVLKRLGVDKKIKYKSGNKKIVGSFESKEGATINEIKTAANKIAADFKNNPKSNGYVMKINVKYNVINKPWKSGKSFKLNEPVQLYDLEYGDSDIPDGEQQMMASQTKFHKFEIVLYKPSAKRGVGTTNKNNDCMYFAIKDSKITMPLKIASPSKFKQYFGLKRSDMFPLEKCQELADLIKAQIKIKGTGQIYGDYKKMVTLKVKNDHITLDDPDYFPNLKAISCKSKEIIVYDENTYDTYDGIELKTNQKEYINEQKKGAKFSSKYVTVSNNAVICYLLDVEKTDLKGIYDKFVLVADNLRSLTNNKIDLYRCGSVLSHYSLDILNKSLNIQYKTESIDEFENNFIKIGGGMLFAEEYNGYVYEYDMKKAYQSILLKNGFRIPIKRPTYEIFDQSNIWMKIISLIIRLVHICVQLKNLIITTKIKYFILTKMMFIRIMI